MWLVATVSDSTDRKHFHPAGLDLKAGQEVEGMGETSPRDRSRDRPAFVRR